MPIITDGDNATASLKLCQLVQVIVQNGAVARVEWPVGTLLCEFSDVRTFGPMDAACSLKIISVSRDISYEVGGEDNEGADAPDAEPAKKNKVKVRA